MVSLEPDDPTGDSSHDEPEVSFADVAAEGPGESVEREAGLVEEIGEEIGDGEPGVDSARRAGTDDDPVLGQPTLGSSMGGAPVAGGEEPVG